MRDDDLITNHMILVPHWVDTTIESTETLTYPSVFCVTINLHSDVVQRLSQMLLPEEQQQAIRFRREEDQLRYVIGRATLRKILGGFTKKDLANEQFQRNAYGKPELPHFFNVPLFNLSHSGDYIAIGLDSYPIGIDLEYINRFFEFNELLAPNFSLEEIKQIQQSHAPHDIFYLLWTRKEAYLKNIGYGLTKSPMHVPALSGSHILGNAAKLDSAYPYHTYSCRLPDSDHVLSVCLNNPDNTPPVLYKLHLT